MGIEYAIKVINAITPCFQALLWPLVLLFILFYLRTPIRRFLGNMSEFSLKASTSGLEATAKQQETKVAAEVGAALGAASVSKSDNLSEDKQVLDDEKAREIANIVSQAVRPRIAQQLAEASVLWVDDNPSNNMYERIALEALGIRVTSSTSTEDALEKIRINEYDVIISDINRPPDKQAGYTLLEELQKRQANLCLIFYGKSDLPENRSEARRKGAFGSTDNPQELFQLVTSAIENKDLTHQYTSSAKAVNQGFQAETAVFRWLKDIMPPGTGEIEVNKYGAPDFLIIKSDGTRTGVEVKNPPTSNISPAYIKKLYTIFERTKQAIDNLNVFLVFPDASVAMRAFHNLQNEPLPSKISITFGHLYRGKFQHDASLADTEL